MRKLGFFVMIVSFVGGKDDIVRMPRSDQSWKLCSRGARDGLGMKLLQVMDCLMLRMWRKSFDLRYSAIEHSDKFLSGHNYTGVGAKMFLHIVQDEILAHADNRSFCLGPPCFKMFPSPVEYASQRLRLRQHMRQSLFKYQKVDYSDLLFSHHLQDESVAIHFRWYEQVSKDRSTSWRRFGLEALVKHETALRFILQRRCSDLSVKKKAKNPIRVFVEDKTDSVDYIDFVLLPALRRLAMLPFVSIHIHTSERGHTKANIFSQGLINATREYIHIIIGGDPIRTWIYLAFSGTLIMAMGRRQSFSAFSLSASIVNTGTVLFGGPGFRKQLFPLHIHTDYRKYFRHIPPAKWNRLLMASNRASQPKIENSSLFRNTHAQSPSASEPYSKGDAPIWPPYWNKYVISADHVWIRLPTKLHFLYKKYNINISRLVPDLFTSLPPPSLLHTTTKITPLIFPIAPSCSLLQQNNSI